MPPSSEHEIKILVLTKATVHLIPKDQNMNHPPPKLKSHISDDVCPYYCMSYSENKNEMGVGGWGLWQV